MDSTILEGRLIQSNSAERQEARTSPMMEHGGSVDLMGPQRYSLAAGSEIEMPDGKKVRLEDFNKDSQTHTVSLEPWPSASKVGSCPTNRPLRPGRL